MITVIGEILMDLIEHQGRGEAHPGGSPANVAVALARLGESVSLLTQLGDDQYGNQLLAHLRDNGVDLAPGSLVDCPRTSTAQTSLGSDGQASYTFDITWRRFAASAVDWPDPTVACLHVGSLAAMLAPGADDVAAMVQAAGENSLVSFDPNCRPSLIDRDWARDRVAMLVANSDIVKASLDDLAWLYPGRTHQQVGQDWLERGANLVVVTMGGDGVWARTRELEMALPAPPVDVADTVGAGDAFTAGMLSALGRADLLDVTRRTALAAIDDATLTDVLTFASRVAAITCSRRGADPPTAMDLATSRV